MNSKYFIFVSVIFELVGLVVGGAYVGEIIDKTYGWNGAAQTGLIGIGFITWVIHLVFLMKKIEKAEENQP